MDNESQLILIDCQSSDNDDTRKTSPEAENADNNEAEQGPPSSEPKTPDKNDSDILVIDEDSPELSNNLTKNLNVSEPTSSPERSSDQPASTLREETALTHTESESNTEINGSGTVARIDQSAMPSGGTETDGGNRNKSPEPDKLISATSTQAPEDVSSGIETEPAVLPGTSGQAIQRSVSTPADESNLNQAALTLLKRLEFKNPGRKQMDYGNFNPEESEREKKKLRRFQTSKPRGNVCYKEDGTLFDGRDICDCLNEECPGCFYPCPQCRSPKCGPTCRSSRKWVYDYIEDEAHTYKVEFPESAINFGV